MDFLSSLAKGESKPSSDQPDNSGHPQKPSNSDLFASAKMVADAAQAQFRNEPEKYDKAKVAGATADLLDAASQYGKLDETKGVGKYVDQAENYLRQYNTTSQSSTTAPVPVPDSTDHKNTTAPVPDSGEQKPITTDAPAPVGDSEDYKTATTTTETTEAAKPSGGAGDYVKMAEGFLNKQSGSGAEGGGAGDYIKMAEGFLNKPSGEGGEKTEASSQSEGGYGDLMKMAGGFLKK
ncbi:Nodulin-related protein 1 [Sesamum alatum]|uniref:Nodulin-related protein 1 n=1 Tax=Sesamum alatum TaxID=300844 RepID=A0AAE2CQ55_9LAMI|nr:Nodulin-related protein 1 [Sesamum alatum]